MTRVGYVEMSKADLFGRLLQTGNRIVHFAWWDVGQIFGRGGYTMVRRCEQLIGITVVCPAFRSSSNER